MTAYNNITENIIADCADYAVLLENSGFPFVESGPWLIVGTPKLEGNWVLYLNTRLDQVTRLIETILPLLKRLEIPLRIPKDQLAVNKLNGYGFGIPEVGKVVTIYPRSTAQAVAVAEELAVLTEGFRGLEIPGSLRLGQILYTAYCELVDNDGETLIRHCIPKGIEIPFRIPRKYKRAKRRRLIGKYYVPVQVLSSLPKGDNYKCINLRKMAFSWCVIKQGKAHASDDFFGRDIRDRLAWQKTVIRRLAGFIPTPKYLDSFEMGEDSYLVLDYVEGVVLRQKVLSLCNNQHWSHYPNEIKSTLLDYFLQILRIVERIHQNGYVHRDITDGNFIVGPDGIVSIIDFELSYSMREKQPFPAFGLGTFGYMSPEQLAFAVPTRQEDVYSLGALLVFIQSGIHPRDFLADVDDTKAKLEQISDDNKLIAITIRCLNTDPGKRPTLQDIGDVVLAASMGLHEMHRHGENTAFTLPGKQFNTEQAI